MTWDKLYTFLAIGLKSLGVFFNMNLWETFPKIDMKWYFWTDCFCGQHYCKEIVMEKMNQINWKVKHFPVESLCYKIYLNFNRWFQLSSFSLLLHSIYNCTVLNTCIKYLLSTTRFFLSVCKFPNYWTAKLQAS